MLGTKSVASSEDEQHETLIEVNLMWACLQATSGQKANRLGVVNLTVLRLCSIMLGETNQRVDYCTRHLRLTDGLAMDHCVPIRPNTTVRFSSSKSHIVSACTQPQRG